MPIDDSGFNYRVKNITGNPILSIREAIKKEWYYYNNHY